jgi:ABC-type transporter Mla subunit MlaD
MFDAIQGLVGSKKSRKGSEDLEALVATAREERDALAALLDELAARSAILTQTHQVLEDVTAKAAAATVTTEALETRIQNLEHRAAGLGAIEDRVNALVAATATAQRQIEKVVAPDGDLEQQRRHGRELAAQLSEAQAVAAAISDDRSTFDALRAQLQQSNTELEAIKQSVELAVSVRAELEQLRGTATYLTQDVASIRDASREADDNAFSAAEAVKEMERRLGQIESLRELSDTVEEKLTALNTLAEHVNQKMRVLEAQKQVIDRAGADTDRLNELVWGMEAQVAKLDGWLRQADRTEERLSRLDQLTSELNAKLDVATSVGEDFRASFLRTTLPDSRPISKRCKQSCTRLVRCPHRSQATSRISARARPTSRRSAERWRSSITRIPEQHNSPTSSPRIGLLSRNSTDTSPRSVPARRSSKRGSE